jgi:hypothetical protein
MPTKTVRNKYQWILFHPVALRISWLRRFHLAILFACLKPILTGVIWLYVKMEAGSGLRHGLMILHRLEALALEF